MALMASAVGYNTKQTIAASYKSRGKGKNSKPGRNYFKSNSKYKPHYGKKESAKFAARNPELREAA